MNCLKQAYRLRVLIPTAADKGRTVDMMTFSHVICRSTQAEAEAEWQRILDNADTDASLIKFVPYTMPGSVAQPFLSLIT